MELAVTRDIALRPDQRTGVVEFAVRNRFEQSEHRPHAKLRAGVGDDHRGPFEAQALLEIEDLLLGQIAGDLAEEMLLEKIFAFLVQPLIRADQPADAVAHEVWRLVEPLL